MFSWRKAKKHTVLIEPHTEPASIPSFFFNISITHTPETFSSLIIVCCIGAGPRYAGNNEGCTLSLRIGWNSLSCAAVNIRPNDAVMSKWLSCDTPRDLSTGMKGWGGCQVNISSKKRSNVVVSCTSQVLKSGFFSGMVWTGSFSFSPKILRGAAWHTSF